MTCVKNKTKQNKQNSMPVKGIPQNPEGAGGGNWETTWPQLSYQTDKQIVTYAQSQEEI